MMAYLEVNTYTQFAVMELQNVSCLQSFHYFPPEGDSSTEKNSTQMRTFLIKTI